MPEMAFFLKKQADPAALFLLKEFVVEQLQFAPDCPVQFGKGEELLIPKGGGDPRGYHSYGSFCIWLILWSLTRAGIMAVP